MIEHLMMKSSVLFKCGPLPPPTSTLIMSTCRHPHAKFSQVFSFFFATLLLLCIVHMEEQIIGRPGNEARPYSRMFLRLWISVLVCVRTFVLGAT